MTNKKTRIIGEITMGWFGPSKDEVWRQLSELIGAEFVDSGFWKGSKAQAHVGPWSVTLDINNDGESQSTRIRARYVNPEGFPFTIYRKGFFSDLGKLLGMQNIAVGDPDFDGAFVIKGNSEEKVRDLFTNARIRQIIQRSARGSAGG
jgi:hypothetical protein